MSEAAAPGPTSAGTRLRAAREARGLDLDTLATTLRVAPAKLEALEADQFERLGDATFVRALAASVCRALRIDAGDVLEGLPRSTPGTTLEMVNHGLNAPFRDRPGRQTPADGVPSRHVALSAAGVLAVLAAALVAVPPSWIEQGPWRAWLAEVPPAVRLAAPRTAEAGAGSAATAAAAADGAARPAPASEPAAVRPPRASAVVASAAPAVASAAPADPAAPVAAAASAALVLQARATSWVEVRSRDGRPLLSRTLRAGEVAQIDAQEPLTLVVGNAAATQVRYRGRDIDLAAQARDNVVRLELP